MGLFRVLLAIAVVVVHSAPVFGITMTGGLVAVEMFFVLSGFYMTLILSHKYVGPGSYKLFLSNRALRLYPVFWVVLLLTVLVAIGSFLLRDDWMGLAPYVIFSEQMSLSTLLATIAANLFLVGQDWLMFAGLDTATGGLFFAPDFTAIDTPMWVFLLIPPAWTLGVELTFYVIAPFIVNRRWQLIVGLIAISLAIRLLSYSNGLSHDPWTYRFFPSELALFLLGTLSYRFYQQLRAREALAASLQWFAFAGLLFVVLLYQWLPLRGVWGGHFLNWLLYLQLAVSLPFVFELTRHWRWDNRIGELSYPIYIVHGLVLALLLPQLQAEALASLRGAIAVLVSIVAAYLLVRWVADPIERLRARRVESRRKLA